MKNPPRLVSWCSALWLGALWLGFAAASCAKVSEKTDPMSGSGGRRGGGTGGFRPTVPPPMPCDNNMCSDLKPVTPDDPSLPGMFTGSPPAPNGLCISEPEDHTLFPNNWLRPRVKFTNASHEPVRISMKAANQTMELTAYTTQDHWELPADIWGGLRLHQTMASDEVLVTVWLKSGKVGQTRFMTAPVGAAGKMVFWAANPREVGKDLQKVVDAAKNAGMPYVQGSTLFDADSELRGFAVGDETTASVLKVSQVQQVSKDNNGMNAPVRCIGCHVATPDGAFVGFNDAWPWRMAIASVEGGTMTGTRSMAVSVGGLQDMQQNGLGISTFSKAHWAEGDYIAITSYGRKCAPDKPDCNYSDEATKNPTPQLAWFDLGSPAAVYNDVANMKDPRLVTGTNMGFIARTGDARGAASPTWSHDGQTIVYSSTSGALDGRLDGVAVNQGDTDLWQVPYGNKAGGTAKPVKGGDEPAYWEYYPAFSPDDALIAFTRVPRGQVMYANPSAQLYVVPLDGSVAPVPVASDPPACAARINNHWPRWSPKAQPGADGRTYYWIVFSSSPSDIPAVQTRCATEPDKSTICYNGAKPTATITQLYMAGVIREETGFYNSTPPIYLWNQPTGTINTTPAWEDFQIPMVE